jgi:hypothetical protein
MKKCPWCGKEYPDEVSACVVDQSPLESRDPVPAPAVSQPEDTRVSGVESSKAPGQEAEGAAAPDGFRSLGVFDAFEADRLLTRFLEAHIRFQIDRIERRERGGSTSYRAVGYIDIFIHVDDYEKASQILTADWKV